MFHSGVGHEAVASRDLVTDLSISLQSGKTADILRFAAESADLPRLPHCLGRFTACGPARPAGHPPEPSAPADSPLAQEAYERLAPPIEQFCRIVVLAEIVFVVGKRSLSRSAWVLMLYVV